MSWAKPYISDYENGPMPAGGEPTTGWNSDRALEQGPAITAQEAGSSARWLVAPQQRGNHDYQGLQNANTSQWGGPMPFVARQWQMNIGGWGARARGFWQSGEMRTISPPNPLLQQWYQRQRSLRHTSQRVNGSANGFAVSGVFVPTAPVNNRGQGYSA